MQLNPYLNFNGQCDAALKFYEKVLDAKTLFKMTWGESPMAKELPAASQNLIMHATLAVGDSRLMCADASPDRYQKPTGMNVSLHLKDAAKAEQIFAALADGGKVTMPYAATFWSKGFGMCIDQFGIPWMVNCEQEP